MEQQKKTVSMEALPQVRILGRTTGKDIVNLFWRKSGSFLRVVGLCDGRHNFFGIESGFRAVPLDDFHSIPLLFRAKIPENRSK